jgi:hypothetical protein
MNTKDALILLIFSLAILGLIIGIYYTEDISSGKPHQKSYERLYEDHGDVLTITLEKLEKNRDLSKFFT